MLSSIFLLCCLLVAVLFDGMPHRAPLRHNADDGYLFVAAKVDGSAADESRIIVPTLPKRPASGAAKMPKSLRKQVRGPVTEREIAYARLTDLIGVDPEDLPSSLAAKLVCLFPLLTRSLPRITLKAGECLAQLRRKKLINIMICESIV